jgi:hypothetical protein
MLTRLAMRPSDRSMAGRLKYGGVGCGLHRRSELKDAESILFPSRGISLHTVLWPW